MGPNGSSARNNDPSSLSQKTSPKSGDLLEAGHDPVKLLPKDILQVPAQIIFRRR